MTPRVLRALRDLWAQFHVHDWAEVKDSLVRFPLGRDGEYELSGLRWDERCACGTVRSIVGAFGKEWRRTK